MTKEFEEFLKKDGYSGIKEITHNGQKLVCGLQRFAFTYGLVIGLNEIGYDYRYCFPNVVDAILVLAELTELPNDPVDLKGNWIKCKGLGYECPNPNYK